MDSFETRMIRYDDRIYAIDQQMVRSYVVVGEEKALCFDFGVVPAGYSRLLRGITDLPFVYVLSHADMDHVANLDVADNVHAAPGEMPSLAGYPGCRLSPLHEGMCFDLGGVCLEVVVTPGHTPGSVSLLWRKEKTLFSGDTVSYGPVYMFGPGRDLDGYIRSLEKLSDMECRGDFSRIYPAHNTAPVNGAAIRDLISIAKGIRDGSCAGCDPQRDFPGFPGVRLFKGECCGIYYQPR